MDDYQKIIFDNSKRMKMITKTWVDEKERIVRLLDEPPIIQIDQKSIGYFDSYRIQIKLSEYDPAIPLSDAHYLNKQKIENNRNQIENFILSLYNKKMDNNNNNDKKQKKE